MMESAVNPGMCRCCASEGAFKDIKSTYHWMGEEEIYADMLRECFDIILNVSGQGEDGGICEVCITQLRNAINFKKQVLHTEKQFQKHLQNKTLFRPNIVKVEVQGDEESDDNMASGDEGFSGTEYEVPIKTELDDPKPKKRAAKASATTTRASAKKAKSDNGETSTKHKQEATVVEIEIETNAEETVSPTVQAVAPRKYNCIACDRSYLTRSFLSAHFRRFHLKEKSHECIECGRAFFRNTDLKKHMLIHTGAKDFKCEVCTKSFATKSNLNQHARIHNNDKRFRCDLCDQAFVQKPSLTYHMRAKHEDVLFV